MRRLLFMTCLLTSSMCAWAGRVVTDSIVSQKLGAMVK